MTAHPRVTRATRRVLQALLAATEDQPAWGYSICTDANLASGTVYPILDRLESHGWIIGRFETDPPRGRPRRRYYQLTDAGRRLAEQAVGEGA